MCFVYLSTCCRVPAYWTRIVVVLDVPGSEQQPIVRYLSIYIYIYVLYLSIYIYIPIWICTRISVIICVYVYTAYLYILFITVIYVPLTVPLYHCTDTVGAIPTEVGQLSSLLYMDLHDNPFQGKFQVLNFGV